MRAIVMLLFTFGYSCAGYSLCDPTRFGSVCEIPFTTQVQPDSSMVYCGDRLGFISRSHYEVLRRYQRASTNMILTVNGEYLDSPCIPAGRYLTDEHVARWGAK
jgi:hypothetical protein